MAVSAMSHRTPPCSVPMGLKCCGPVFMVTTARPSPDSVTAKPIRSPMGNPFLIICSRKVPLPAVGSDIIDGPPRMVSIGCGGCGKEATLLFVLQNGYADGGLENLVECA